MSSRKVNQNESNFQLESSTLLSKLDHLSAQMEIAFPSSLSTCSSTKDSNVNELNQKSPIKRNQLTSSSQSLNKATDKVSNSTDSQSIDENKENIDANDRLMKTDNKLTKQIKSTEVELLPNEKLESIDTCKTNDNSKKLIKADSIEKPQNSPTENASKQTTSSANSSVNTSIVTTNKTNTGSPNLNLTVTQSTNKLWKRTKILSKTLSSMEVIRKSKTTTSNQPSSTTSNGQPIQSVTLAAQNLKLKTDENQLKKSNSGNLIHLNSPLNQVKRRSQEEVVSNSLNAHRLSSSLSSSCQTSVHNLNEPPKVNTQISIEAAVLNSLNQNSGTYPISDNYNTNIINQLNKNYLKNIQKQKARSDWKSLKSKLIGLGRKDSDEGDKIQNDKPVDTLESSIATNQRKLSGSSQTTTENDGIICKKEDLLLLLRNSNLKNKQRRSNKPSLADVVFQLQENKAKVLTSQDKNQSDSNENLIKATSNENNLNQNNLTSAKVTSISTPSSSINKIKNSTNGKVQFALSSSSSEQNTPTSSTPITKIKSSLKKPSSSATSSIDKTNLIRQTKSNTISNSNLHKKKVKIFETDQGNGIRKALVLQSVKDRNNNESKSNDEEEIDGENEIKIDNEELDQNEENLKVKWDDSNIVDAGLLGDAIQAFLSSITTTSTTNTSFSTTTKSTKHHIASTEKKVSFKK